MRALSLSLAHRAQRSGVESGNAVHECYFSLFPIGSGPVTGASSEPC